MIKELILHVSTLLLAALAIRDASAQASTQPNIFKFSTDNQGHADLGCFGSNGNQTPVLDKLAIERTKFTTFYTQPVCGSSRSALLTGADETLGYPLGDYGETRRGIEPTRPDDLPDSGRDNVTLSRDRRTLSPDLSASSAVDQIRVVVSE